MVRWAKKTMIEDGDTTAGQAPRHRVLGEVRVATRNHTETAGPMSGITVLISTVLYEDMSLEHSWVDEDGVWATERQARET